MTPSYKENPHNRSILIRLFGEEWIKKRDKDLEALRPKTKQQQLKLEL